MSVNVFALLADLLLPDLTHLVIQYLRGLTISLLANWDKVPKDDEKGTRTYQYYSPFLLQPSELSRIFYLQFPLWLLHPEPEAKIYITDIFDTEKWSLLQLCAFFLLEPGSNMKKFISTWLKIWDLCDSNCKSERESLVLRTKYLCLVMRCQVSLFHRWFLLLQSTVF